MARLPPSKLMVRRESWPIAGAFVISRGSKTSAEVVVAELDAGDGVVGRGECVPYARYGETVAEVAARLEALRPALAEGLDQSDIPGLLPPGAARNALDCAAWDLLARQTGLPAWQLADLPPPRRVLTARTISLGSPSQMAETAVALAARGADPLLLKLKLGADGVVDRVAGVRRAVPSARLVVDANEAWPLDLLAEVTPSLAALGVELIEQPLPAGADAGLETFVSPVPLCADESAHSAADVPVLAGRYRCVNVKLDKAGGLTGAIAMVRAAREAGIGVMIGCMVATSLAMAPALLLAGEADYVDLDGPLILDRDRPYGLDFVSGWVYPPNHGLWG